MCLNLRGDTCHNMKDWDKFSYIKIYESLFFYEKSTVHLER